MWSYLGIYKRTRISGGRVGYLPLEDLVSLSDVNRVRVSDEWLLIVVVEEDERIDLSGTHYLFE